MPRIDFYVLASASEEARFNFAAKLCNKALQNKLNALIWVANQQRALQMDELLWITSPESYLPHAINPSAEPAPPIIISVNHDQPGHRQILMQLTDELHPDWQHFDRVIEIVIQSDDVLAGTRQRYKNYKSQGLMVQMHHI